LLAEDVQVIPKVSVTDELASLKDSGSDWVPLVAFVPAQPSPGSPPVAVQLVAFVEPQVKVVEPPSVIVAGDADTVAVTAGHVQVTAATGSAAVAPGAVQ
jgi:hypothetical protein